MLAMSESNNERSNPIAELGDLFFSSNNNYNNFNYFSPSSSTMVGSTVSSSGSADHNQNLNQFFTFNEDETKDFLFYDAGIPLLDEDPEVFFDSSNNNINNLNLNLTELDFTSFLERLDSSTDKMMMQLIARYFHDRISVFREDKKVFNILDDVYNYSPQTFKNDDLSENLSYGRTRVLCSVDVSNCHRAIRDFLSDADELLGSREDLKMALRGVFPPTLASDPIFQSPLNRKRRRAAKNNSISATINALYGPNDDDFDSCTNRRNTVKRGRPRKNTLMTSTNSNNISNNLSLSVAASSVNNEDKKTNNTSTQLKKKESKNEDSAWKPEVVVKKKKQTGKKESLEKKSKVNKAPTDKAKEEADLMAMGLEALEKHTVALQQQMRNVKHKHRKGTICPRCTTEQRLKLAFKAKTKAQNELKNKIITPTTNTTTAITASSVAEEKKEKEKENEVVEKNESEQEENEAEVKSGTEESSE